MDDRADSDITVMPGSEDYSMEFPVPIHPIVKKLNPLVKKALLAYAMSGNQECALEIEKAFHILEDL